MNAEEGNIFKVQKVVDLFWRKVDIGTIKLSHLAKKNPKLFPVKLTKEKFTKDHNCDFRLMAIIIERLKLSSYRNRGKSQSRSCVLYNRPKIPV